MNKKQKKINFNNLFEHVFKTYKKNSICLNYKYKKINRDVFCNNPIHNCFEEYYKKRPTRNLFIGYVCAFTSVNPAKQA